MGLCIQVLAGAAIARLSSSGDIAETADIVLTNAAVQTMNDTQPTAEAVAATGNVATCVSDAAGAQASIGSIEVGKYAGPVVLDQDITTMAPRAISDIKVRGTLLDGRFTRRDGP